MKKEYTEPILEYIEFNEEDIITASCESKYVTEYDSNEGSY